MRTVRWLRRDRLALPEMLEFASFAPSEQRFICRSLDVAAGRGNAIRTWARSLAEARSIRDQARAYRRIDYVRDLAPDDFGFEAAEPMFAPMVAMTAFDLLQGDLCTFAGYRFLYERILGADFRPWFVAAFCAAAVLPAMRSDRRIALLRTIDEATATQQHWSGRQPGFVPQWVEPVPA